MRFFDQQARRRRQTNDGWSWLIAHGATMIQTDRPVELIAYLRQRKLHR